MGQFLVQFISLGGSILSAIQQQYVANSIINAIDSIYQELPEGFPIALIDSIRSGVKKHLDRFAVQDIKNTSHNNTPY